MPREFPGEGLIEFSSRVPKSDYDEFIGNFPLHGATSWFIRTALREFNISCRDNPNAIAHIRANIQKLTTVPQPTGE
jgi:hypothetical protein